MELYYLKPEIITFVRALTSIRRRRSLGSSRNPPLRTPPPPRSPPQERLRGRLSFDETYYLML